jgi:hypothetical protein
MRPERHRLELSLQFICLLISLIFMVVSSIPVVGYMVQIAAIFAFILFSFRSQYVFWVIGSAGSLAVAIMLFGFSFTLLCLWATVVVPGTILGRLTVSGTLPARAFVLGLSCSVIMSAVLFVMERKLILAGVDNSKEALLALLGNLGEQNAPDERLMEYISRVFSTIKRLTPSLMALSAVLQLFMGWLGLLILYRILGEFLPAPGGFRYWKMPYSYIYLTGSVIFIRLIGTEQMRIVADNLLVFLGFFYAVFGFSVFEYYLKKIRLSLFIRLLFYIGIVFLQLPGLILAAIVGLFDSYFDFRKVRAKIIG